MYTGLARRDGNVVLLQSRVWRILFKDIHLQSCLNSSDGRHKDFLAVGDVHHQQCLTQREARTNGEIGGAYLVNIVTYLK